MAQPVILKSQLNFNYLLGQLARADGKHDFGGDWNELSKGNAADAVLYNSSLPLLTNITNKSKDDLDEISCMHAINALGGWAQQRTLPILNIGFFSPAFVAIHNYSRASVVVNADLFSDKYDGTPINQLENNSVLIIDFAHHHFIEKIKTGPPRTNVNVYYAMTPEVLNDPAPKPSLYDSKYKAVTGVNFIPCLQVDSDPPVHIYNPTTGTQFTDKKDLFFSYYTFALNQIEKKNNKQLKYEKISGTISVTDYTNGNNLTFNSTPNTKLNDNSINRILDRIKKFFKKLNNKKNEFEVIGGLQRKRSGDWLQVLCCFDIYNRTFIDVKNKVDKVYQNQPIRFAMGQNKVYFVTHDQIACAYALLMGANVLFFAPSTYYPRSAGMDKTHAILYKNNFENQINNAYQGGNSKIPKQIKNKKKMKGGAYDKSDLFPLILYLLDNPHKNDVGPILEIEGGGLIGNIINYNMKFCNLPRILFLFIKFFDINFDGNIDEFNSDNGEERLGLLFQEDKKIITTLNEFVLGLCMAYIHPTQRTSMINKFYENQNFMDFLNIIINIDVSNYYENIIPFFDKLVLYKINTQINIGPILFFIFSSFFLFKNPTFKDFFHDHTLDLAGIERVYADQARIAKVENDRVDYIITNYGEDISYLINSAGSQLEQILQNIGTLINLRSSNKADKRISDLKNVLNRMIDNLIPLMTTYFLSDLTGSLEMYQNAIKLINTSYLVIIGNDVINDPYNEPLIDINLSELAEERDGANKEWASVAPVNTGFGHAPPSSVFGRGAPAVRAGFGHTQQSSVFGRGAPAVRAGFVHTPPSSVFGRGAPAVRAGFGNAPPSSVFGRGAPVNTGFGHVQPQVFGHVAPVSSGFGHTPTSSVFGRGAPVSSGFGHTPTSSVFGRGAPVSSGFGHTPTSSVFGRGAPAVRAGFGHTPTSSVFGRGAPAVRAGFGNAPPSSVFGRGAPVNTGFGHVQPQVFGNQFQKSNASGPGFAGVGNQSTGFSRNASTEWAGSNPLNPFTPTRNAASMAMRKGGNSKTTISTLGNNPLDEETANNYNLLNQITTTIEKYNGLDLQKVKKFLLYSNNFIKNPYEDVKIISTPKSKSRSRKPLSVINEEDESQVDGESQAGGDDDDDDDKQTFNKNYNNILPYLAVSDYMDKLVGGKMIFYKDSLTYADINFVYENFIKEIINNNPTINDLFSSKIVIKEQSSEKVPTTKAYNNNTQVQTKKVHTKKVQTKKEQTTQRDNNNKILTNPPLRTIAVGGEGYKRKKYTRKRKIYIKKTRKNRHY